jgi:hypothetical protein
MNNLTAKRKGIQILGNIFRFIWPSEEQMPSIVNPNGNAK